MAESKQNDPLHAVTKHLYVDNDFNNVLGSVANKIGVKREYLVAGWITLMCLSLVIGVCTQFLTTLTAICYQSYITVTKMESGDKDFRIQWSMYWTIFGHMVLLETWVDYIIHFFPFYYLFKVIFVIWCSAPSPKNGSTMIYEKVVAPFILKKDAGKSN